jgi:nicotinate-nucleotide adenylyltransferase
MKLGILGGSFNPIHHGHLIIATRAAEALRLDRVLFIPTAVSPLKRSRDFAPPKDRLAMVRAAVRGNSRFAASDVEIRRGGTSYTIDTLKALSGGRRSSVFLILGVDAAHLLPQWRSVDEVKRLATLVFVARPGHRPGRGMPKHLVVEVPQFDISSSEIRTRIRRNLPIRYLVPDSVERYIRRKGLYR